MEEMETLGNGEGNTKTSPTKRCVPSKRWCFTYHWKDWKQIEALLEIFKKREIQYYFGEEICPDTGRQHLQGYIECSKKIRPSEYIGIKEIHWEKCKGTKEQNIIYCGKDGKITTNMKIKKKIEDPMEGLTYYTYQKELLKIFDQKPDKRKIYYIWEPDGGAGKSDFTTHMCLTRSTLAVSGAGKDVKFGLATALEEKDIDIVIFDLPRVAQDYICWSGLEEIKNGRIFNTKYESGMKIFNRPHIVIFANQPPENKLSKDKLITFKIEKQKDDYIMVEQEEEEDLNDFL